MLKKLTNINMTWKKTIIFALITGIYTGIVAQVPFLKDTSFRDIAIGYEWWVLFATVIAINCKKPMDAALKVFVFFLISQPLVFIVELPTLGFAQALYYYKLWIIPTVLTLPGGFIAYHAKKDNWLGALILSVATVFLGIHAVAYALDGYKDFPHHILSAIFCLFQIILLIQMLIKNNKFKAMAYSLTVVGMVVACFVTLSAEDVYNTYIPDGEWTVETQLNDKSHVTIDGNSLSYYYKSFFVEDKTIVLKDKDNNKFEIEVKKEENGKIQVSASNNY